MTKLEITKRGSISFKQITSKRLQDRLDHLLDLVVEVPTFGSKLTRGSIKEEFGENCLKADLAPFLLLYEYDEIADIVHVYGIVYAHSIK